MSFIENIPKDQAFEIEGKMRVLEEVERQI